MDSYHKSLLDALKHARLIVDDSRQWCEITPATFSRALERKTVITIKDINVMSPAPSKARRSVRASTRSR